MIRLRPIRAISEFHACERLQTEVWRFVDREIIPSNELVTISHNGGRIIGAFEGHRLVGFCFGFPGIRGREVYHVSRMLAVRRGLRDRGLGFRLKCAQRAFVLRQGLDRIRWTFDPLQARNAFFNIEKLGCTVREYHVDIYGPSTSVLNRGLPTDRIIADWEIRSARVRRALRSSARGPSAVISGSPTRGDWLLESRTGPAGLPVPGRVRSAPPQARELLCEIPARVEELQARHLPLALRWRYAIRRALRGAFRRGFVITGVIRWRVEIEARVAYLLSRATH